MAVYIMYGCVQKKVNSVPQSAYKSTQRHAVRLDSSDILHG